MADLILKGVKMFRVIVHSYGNRVREINHVYLMETNDIQKKIYLHIENRDYFGPIVIDLKKCKYISVVG